MKTTLKNGQITDSGFEILAIKDLAELDADGVWARHVKTGTEVFHVLNDDRENLFSFTFATIPEDSTGVAHILEHSVLCGSRNYPLKDAFLILAQGSLQTYLNAWTFPDKTVYPASSVNEQDYFNLMSVYGDAVFRPLISEWTFMQEGHHLDFAGPEKSGAEKNAPRISGVVYNEMKGAYSSPEAYAGLWSVKSVMPDTPYAFESGGDPLYIPDLTWDGLKRFHASRYSPANCRVFLAGNIPTEKQLAFLDEKFFRDIPGGRAAAPVPRTKRWTQSRSIRVPCPAGEQKSTAFISILCGDASNPEESLDLGALAETLLGHDGSPLTRALVESGLGEDLAPVTGLEGELLESVFTVGLRGVAPENCQMVERFILDELKRLVNDGIPAGEIEATLLALEFSHREIRRAGGPFSLVWLRRSMRSWLHGGKPWDSLLLVPLLEKLKSRLASNPRYFEDLIQKYLLDNPHRAFVTVEPEKGFLEKQEADLAGRLAKQEAAMSASEKTALAEKNRELARIQEQPDSPEALASIPHLVRKDLSAKIEAIPRELAAAGGVPVSRHELFTNGISYVDIGLPVDTLELDDYRWLPFFSRAVVSLGLPGMDYGEVSSLLARTAGGFHAMLDTGSRVPSSPETVAFPSGVFDIRGRDWIIFRLKALDEKIGPSLDLARRLITEADFTDLKRVRTLILEMKNQIDSSLAPIGHNYASLRSGRVFSRSRGIEEIWNGIEQLRFIHEISGLDSAELGRRLSSIRDKLIASGVLVNFSSGAASAGNGMKEIAASFGAFGPPAARNAVLPENPAVKPGPEVFASPSLQIGFAGAVLPVTLFGPVHQAAELILSHLLSTGALWEEIRMKGGAYGASAHPDLLESAFSFSTYRDPAPLKSLDAFRAILRTFSDYSGETLEKAIIGSYSGETRPRTGAEKGMIDFIRLLYGIEDSARSGRLQALVNAKEEEIAAILTMLASAEIPCPVVITGRRDAEKAAAELGVEVQRLPV